VENWLKYAILESALLKITSPGVFWTKSTKTSRDKPITTLFNTKQDGPPKLGPSRADQGAHAPTWGRFEPNFGEAVYIFNAVEGGVVEGSTYLDGILRSVLCLLAFSPLSHVYK
jgi:hypothetical protein